MQTCPTSPKRYFSFWFRPRGCPKTTVNGRNGKSGRYSFLSLRSQLWIFFWFSFIINWGNICKSTTQYRFAPFLTKQFVGYRFGGNKTTGDRRQWENSKITIFEISKSIFNRFSILFDQKLGKYTKFKKRKPWDVKIINFSSMSSGTPYFGQSHM